MKKFIKLIPVFLVFCLTSITVNAQDSTSLCLEDLNTDVYEDILTEYYEVEAGYAYCSGAVNLTSSEEITEDISVTILDAYGSNVWRVDTSLSAADSNCAVVELNNNFYYLSTVSNPVFTDEGVTFSTNKLGIYIAGGCFSEEEIENFSASSLFSIEDGTYTFDGTTYNLADGTLLDNDYATGYLFSDGRLIVTAFKKNGSAASSYPWYTSKSSITKLSFDDSITFIGSEAFYEYSDITGELVLPSSCVEIYSYAFASCEGFTGDLVIPNCITKIESYAFAWCSGFTGDLILGEKVSDLGAYTFAYNNFQGNLVFNTTELVNIPAWCFNSCGFTGELIIPNTVQILGLQSFLSCGFDSLTLGSSVKTIESGSFSYCENLSGDITIPSSVTTMEYEAFSNCSSLNGKIVIPDSITEIEDYTFYHTSIKKIIGGNNVTSIGTDAFLYEVKGADNNYTAPDNPLLISIDSENSVLLNYDWSTANRKSTTYVLNTTGDLFGYLDTETGILTITGTGTNLDKQLRDVLITTEEREAFKGIVFNTNTIEEICDYWCYNRVKDTETGEHITCFPNLMGALVIPNSVVSICDNAFGYCSGFTGDLVLPDSVTSIEGHAFYKCSGFTGDLIIPDSVTTLGENAFYNCSGFNGTLTLSNRLQTIGNWAFEYCTGFTGDLVIPDSVTSIGMYAFFKCSGFNATLKLSNNLSIIERGTFANCSSLTGHLIIPDSVTSIDDSAFYHCSGFTGDLIIPDSVTTLGNGAFMYCSGFTSLTISDKISILSEEVFYNCSGLTGDLVIPDSITTISNSAFKNCSSLTGVLTIPNSVTTIGDQAFYDCTGFTSGLIIPNSVTSIGSSAFRFCNFKSVIIPDSVTTIGDEAFYYCSELTFIDIGSGVDSLGASVFNVYSNTKTNLVTGNEVILNYDWAADRRTINLIKKYVLNTAGDLFGYLDNETGVMTIRGTGTKLDKKLSDVLATDEERALLTGLVFETDTIEDIGNYWCNNYFNDSEQYFSNLGGTLELPRSINSIGSYAFRKCSGFTGSLVIPSNVTSIGKYAFVGCSGFTGDLVIPDGVDSIGLEAFSKCFGFTGNLIIPNSVTSIGDYAFEYCSGFNGTLMLSNQLTELGNGTFRYCSGFTGDLVIPQGVTTLGERTDSSWSYGTFFGCTGFNGLLSLPSSLTSIGDRVFYDCSNLTGTLSIPESITTIGNSSFYNCGKLTGSLIIPDSVTYIGGHAFENCKGFDGNLILPKNIDVIREATFRDCNKLTGSINIPITVTEIESGAFNRCSSFTGDLVIPNSVVKIGSDSFNGCRSLKGTLTLSENLTVIESGAFGSDGSGRGFFSGTLYIPDSVVTISDKAFCYSEFNTIILGNNIANIGIEAFDWCTNLDKIYIGSNIQNIGTNCFYSPYVTQTKLYTKNQTVLDYDWAGDNRTIVPMNTFTVTIPEEITLKPKYVADSDAPIWYTSFNMEVTGDFENGSYGVYEKLSSFTIKTEDGETRTVTTNIEDATVNENGTITVPVELTAPDPTLLEEFTGELKLNTVLHEMIPFAA